MGFGLYDENDLCRAYFNPNNSKEENLEQLNYETYCSRISSNDYNYCKEIIESWYDDDNSKETISEKELEKRANEADLNRNIIINKYANVILKLYGRRVLECYKNRYYLSKEQIKKALRCYYNVK